MPASSRQQDYVDPSPQLLWGMTVAFDEGQSSLRKGPLDGCSEVAYKPKTGLQVERGGEHAVRLGHSVLSKKVRTCEGLNGSTLH